MLHIIIWFLIKNLLTGLKKIYKCTHTGREGKCYFEYEWVKISCNNYYYSNRLRPRAFIQVLWGGGGSMGD